MTTNSNALVWRKLPTFRYMFAAVHDDAATFAPYWFNEDRLPVSEPRAL